MPGCQLLLAVTTIAGPLPPASSASASHARRRQHLLLHQLPFLVQAVERLGDGARLDRIVCRKQAAAECCIADAPAGIDARADQIGQMEGADRLADARHPRQCGQPLVLLLARHLQPLDHEGAVDAGKRHHVADGGKGDEIEQGKQVRRRRIDIRPRRILAVCTRARKTTPAAQRWPCPERSSSRLGLTTAIAAGRHHRPDGDRARRHRRRPHWRHRWKQHCWCRNRR